MYYCNRVDQDNDLTMDSQFRIFSQPRPHGLGSWIQAVDQLPGRPDLVSIRRANMWDRRRDMVIFWKTRQYRSPNRRDRFDTLRRERWMGHRGHRRILIWVPSSPDPNQSTTSVICTEYTCGDDLLSICYINIIAPAILLTLVSVLVFALPAASGEKISLEISVLLSYSVLMLLVSDIMPKNGKALPIIGRNKSLIFTKKIVHLQIWRCMTFAVNVPYRYAHRTRLGFPWLFFKRQILYHCDAHLQPNTCQRTWDWLASLCFATVFVLNLHHRLPRRRMPAWAWKVFLRGFGRIVCMASATTHIMKTTKRNHIPLQLSPRVLTQKILEKELKNKTGNQECR